MGGPDSPGVLLFVSFPGKHGSSCPECSSLGPAFAEEDCVLSSRAECELDLFMPRSWSLLFFNISDRAAVSPAWSPGLSSDPAAFLDNAFKMLLD